MVEQQKEHQTCKIPAPAVLRGCILGDLLQDLA